ncbi:M20 family metallopeptidase [Paenibacillus nasutitermitis]|uniref:Acetylornithine deacetylase n=1 Tax=Paenibacillus nasutitermitis TaxID=1652958 RepID=A0A917E1T9_9BACL|nr:M20/M25/M40 family metallo-hydrolase [Paenibacillus nasutitermitis]GGD93714.1 acetylornithine deacetylase [Paenibacillus nasutitermitis]
MSGNERNIPVLIRDWIQLNRGRMADLLSTLIRYDTVNRVVTGTEKECQQKLHELMQELGLEAELYYPEEVPGFHEHPAYYPGKDYSDRPNVSAKWRGTGGGKSLLFSSHIDTAAIAPGWETDPFSPFVEDNKLFGLGSYDMKGGLAASMMAARCLMELGIKLQGDVLIESVVDEEFGGANGTVAGRAHGVTADAVIIPEPTNLALYPAARGGALWRVTFRGTTGLSFSGEVMQNPANDAARFIVFLEKHEQERADLAGPAPWYSDRKEQLPIIVTRLEAGDLSSPLCDVGPVECHVDIWVECYPGVSEDQLREELLLGYERFSGRSYEQGLARPEFNKMIRFLPGCSVAPDFPLLPILAEEIESATGRKAEVTGAPYACDAFVFNEYGSSPALILGPSGGNAHAPGEFVDLDSLVVLVEIYATSMLRWCGRST